MLLALLLAASLPDFTGYVVDRAHLLDPNAVVHVTAVASRVDHAGVAQLAGCTVPESALGDDPLEDYAVALFKKWGLGHGTKRDDGLLVLFVPGAPGHRKIRIEVGYGLEGILPDGKVGQIRTQQAFPYMRNNDFSGAAVHVVDARSEEHTSELQSLAYLVCRLLLEKKKIYLSESVNAGHAPHLLFINILSLKRQRR